jgi:hypothetical protein
MLIADHNNEIAGVEAALPQIEMAYETARSGGDQPLLAYFQTQRAKAQAIRDRLASVAKP